MYVRMRGAEAPSTGSKPKVLIVLQGLHHLMLYENIFKYCTQFQWYCLLPDMPKSLDVEAPKQFYFRYGVIFFSDPLSCIAHIGHFDAVVTTWAVPHAKHLSYIKFIALAYELGLPVFELQHGLFQLGLTYSEFAPVVGSGPGAAIAAPDVENLTTNVIRWFGEDGIGYPRSPTFDDREGARRNLKSKQVVFVTNHHWGILTDDERRACYEIMYETIRTLSAVDFVLLPHTGELKNQAFTDMVAKLDAVAAKNYRIETGRGDGVFDNTICNADLIVGSASTTILDCELSGTPTVMFNNETQAPFLESFVNVVTFSNADELIKIVNDVLYKNYRPEINTGFAQPFRPDRLVSILQAAVKERRRSSAEEVAVVISKYLVAP